MLASNSGMHASLNNRKEGAHWNLYKYEILLTYLLPDRVQEGYSLYCLAKTHFISQDSVSTLGPGEP